MSETEVTHTENKTKDQLISVQCATCNRATKHRVVVSFDEDGTAYDKHEQWSVSWFDHYQVVQCQGCETNSFRHVHWFSEDQNPWEGDDGITERCIQNEVQTQSIQRGSITYRRT